MTEVVFSLEALLAQSVLPSQQKTNNWLQTPGNYLLLTALKAVTGKRSKNGNVSEPMSFSAKEFAFLEVDNAVLGMEIIQRGSCGDLFKTDIITGGTPKTIVIKRIIHPSRDTFKHNVGDLENYNKKMGQIRPEIEMVGLIRHRNILPLLAHVSRPTCHYLVYEYMKFGSLQDILCSVQSGRQELEWIVRHKIAIGVANGLEYLHLSLPFRAVHSNLTPANILLDDDMEARISAFGLARQIPDAKTHITSPGLSGRLGCIAPEYQQTLKLNEKFDIYSFGVLLGVLVMGKLPSDEFFQRTPELSMVSWMRKVMTSDDPREAIHPSLLGNGYEEQMLLVLKIACFCTLDNPEERPTSKDCRIMLSQI